MIRSLLLSIIAISYISSSAQERLPQFAIDIINDCPFDSVPRQNTLKSLSFTIISKPGQFAFDSDKSLAESFENLNEHLSEDEYESQNNAEIEDLEELFKGDSLDIKKTLSENGLGSSVDLATYKMETYYLSPNFIYTETTSPSKTMNGILLKNDKWGVYVKDGIIYDLDPCEYILPIDIRYNVYQNMYENMVDFNEAELIEYQGIQAKRIIGKSETTGWKVTIVYDAIRDYCYELIAEIEGLEGLEDFGMIIKNRFITLNGFMLPKESIAYVGGKIHSSTSYHNYKINQAIDKDIFYSKEF